MSEVEKQPRGDRRGFVTVFETHDPVTLDAAESYLLAHGIDVRALGTRNGALIGAGQHIFGLRLEVAPNEEMVAREALAALASGVKNVAEADLPDELREIDEAPPTPAPRSWLRAAPSAFILPGGAHLYAGRPWSALVIALFEISGFIFLLNGHWEPFITGVLMLAGAILFDLFDALRVLDRAAPTPAVQGLYPLPFLGLITTLAVVAAPHIAEPVKDDRRGVQVMAPSDLDRLNGDR